MYRLIVYSKIVTFYATSQRSYHEKIKNCKLSKFNKVTMIGLTYSMKVAIMTNSNKFVYKLYNSI